MLSFYSVRVMSTTSPVHRVAVTLLLAGSVPALVAGCGQASAIKQRMCDCPTSPPCRRNALLPLDLGVLRPDDVSLLLPCAVTVVQERTTSADRPEVTANGE